MCEAKLHHLLSLRAEIYQPHRLHVPHLVEALFTYWIFGASANSLRLSMDLLGNHPEACNLFRIMNPAVWNNILLCKQSIGNHKELLRYDRNRCECVVCFESRWVSAFVACSVWLLTSTF